MNQELLIAIIAGLGGMFGWGFADFFAKKTIDAIGEMVSLVWAHIFGTLIFFIVFLYQILVHQKEISLPSTITEWGLLAFFGILQGVIYIIVYHGFGKGHLAVLSPVFSTYSGIAALISILIFGEAITSAKFLGLIVLFGGIMLLSLDMKALLTKRLNFHKVEGLKHILLAALLAAFWTIYWGRFVAGKDWVVYALFMYAFMTVAVLVVAKFQHATLSKIPSRLWTYLLLIGVGEAVAYLSISYGFSATPLISVIALLAGAFSLPVIILSHLFLKEEITPLQKFGSIVTVIGVALLAFIVNT